jgi:RNA polymerase sigma-70 factor, ECF subfamily
MEYDVPSYKQAHEGDQTAFTAIFDRYQARIYRYLCSLVDDVDLAEDLAQQTFVRAYQALGRDAPQNLNAWLYAIATNTAFSALRRRRLIAWLPLTQHTEPLVTRDQEAVLGEQELFAQALGQLRKEDAACLLLRFQQELSYEELGEALRVSPAAAKMRLSRARSAFREAYLRLNQEGHK